MVLAIAASFIAVAPSFAADRALIVGVGKHSNVPRADLPGIDLDIKIAEALAREMGFREIKVLRDFDATYENVKQTFRSWLIEGVGPNERALFYFSGHGSQMPDLDGGEPDGLDEVLILSDFRAGSLTQEEVSSAKTRVTVGQNTLRNVLVDDELGVWLSQMKNDYTLVLTDSCHSGTVTKDFRSLNSSFGDAKDGVAKFYLQEGITPSGKTFSAGPADGASRARKYVHIAAAADNQEAIATSNGSIFTLGVQESFRAAKNENKGFTPQRVFEETTRYVANSGQKFRPQLDGDRALATKVFAASNNAPPSGARTAAWTELETLARRGTPITVTMNKSTYIEGDDAINISVNVPTEGYLNIVAVNSAGVPTVLFPNKWSRESKVSPGTIAFPSAAMGFKVFAERPLGENLVAAFLTKQPVNLFSKGNDVLGANGQLQRDLANLSASGMQVLERSFGVKESAPNPAAPGLWSGSVRAKVCAKDNPGNCGP
jgi:hypothetical protein